MASDKKDVILTASDRIKQLNDIDRDVVKLLQSAGIALKALTHSRLPPEEAESRVPSSIEQQKESFTTAISQYFSLLSSVNDRLSRQIKALAEAQILPKEASSSGKQKNLAVPPGVLSVGTMPNMPFSKQAGGNKGLITGGGLGALDIGWLNSRNDNVGKAKEAELWEEAQRSVQRLEEENIRSRSDAAVSREDIRMTEHSNHNQNRGNELEQL